MTVCKVAPINLHSHDVFVTVDLFESKDLAQVLQCIGSFSRAAHRLKPSLFPIQIGGKARGGVVSPQGTGTQVGGTGWGRQRGASNTSNTSSAYSYTRPTGSITPNRTGELSNGGRWSPTKPSSGPLSPASTSRWSKPSDTGVSPPPWSEFQYGSLRGANQGSLGVSFGAPRQITSASPLVPSLADKEKARKEKQEEEERLRREEQKAEEERIRVEEERARAEEERRWAEESEKLRERERLKAEEEHRKWKEEEQRWTLEEKRREKEEKEAEAKIEEERRRVRRKSDVRLEGQFLSQYQAERSDGPESSRIKELERELELARERELEYERERNSRSFSHNRQTTGDQDRVVRRKEETKARSRSRSRPRAPSRKNSGENWRQDERDYLQQQWSAHHNGEKDNPPPSKSPRPLPEPTPPVRVKTNHTGPSSRPLPDPAKYVSPKEAPRAFPPSQNHTDQYSLSSNEPEHVQPRTTYAREISSYEDQQTAVSPQMKPAATTAKPRAQMSIIEREMEEDRQRQREWEQSLKENQTRRGLVGPRPPPS